MIVDRNRRLAACVVTRPYTLLNRACLAVHCGTKYCTQTVVLPSFLRRKVLVVEDDAELRAWYRTTLTAAGYVVVSVEDGLAALRHIDIEPPDVIVLDMGLPRLGGRDVQREIAARADLRFIPIVIVTGADTLDVNPDEVACVLRKPITEDVLLDTVARVSAAVRTRARLTQRRFSNCRIYEFTN